MPAIPARPLEWLLGRRTDALTNLFANVGIVLRHFQNRVVFLHREALVGDSLRQGINGLIQDPLLIGGGRRGYPLLVVLLEAGHALDGGGCCVELLVRDVLRLLGEAGRRRLDLRARYGDEEKSCGKSAGWQRQTASKLASCASLHLHAAPARDEKEKTVGKTADEKEKRLARQRRTKTRSGKSGSS
jgi:hypothetical protein